MAVSDERPHPQRVRQPLRLSEPRLRFVEETGVGQES
jgi:hypothetical protein